MDKVTVSTHNAFEKFTNAATKATGSTRAFIIACLIILIWAIIGPFFHFSNTWQLVITTGTSVATFLMVFLIQKGQNKDSLAIQVKLNELVAANALASNRIISVEDLTEEELVGLNKYYTRLAEMTQGKGKKMHSSHSIEEAMDEIPGTNEDLK
jgi:low affinity Fe/Cu permease